MRTRLKGPDSLEVAESEVALGWTLMESVRLQGLGERGPKEINDFDKMMFHALDIQRHTLGSNHRDVGLTLTWLAVRYFMEGKQQEAEKMLLQAGAVFATQKEGLSAVLGLTEFQAAASRDENGDSMSRKRDTSRASKCWKRRSATAIFFRWRLKPTSAACCATEDA